MACGDLPLGFPCCPPPPCSDSPLCLLQAPHLLWGIDDPNIVAELQGTEHSREDSKDQGPSDSLLGGFPVLGGQKQRGGGSHRIMISALHPGAWVLLEPGDAGLHPTCWLRETGPY